VDIARGQRIYALPSCFLLPYGNKSRYTVHKYIVYLLGVQTRFRLAERVVRYAYCEVVRIGTDLALQFEFALKSKSGKLGKFD
jgi:hypothetical protein